MWPFKKKTETRTDSLRLPPGPEADRQMLQRILSGEGTYTKPEGGRPGRFDGWTSALSGLGVIGQDKRMNSFYMSNLMSPYEAMEMWRGDDIAARIIETIPSEGLRQGFEICIDGDGQDNTDLQRRVTARWEELKLIEKLWKAWCYENCYGGAGIYMGTTDGSPVEEELNYESITHLNWLHVLEPLELQPIKWQNSYNASDLGEPTHYRLNPMTHGGSSLPAVVHASRIIAFPGIRVSRRQISTNFGWGDSRLGRSRDVLRDFHASWAAAGVLVQEFAQAVYKIKGLSEIIAFDKDQELKDRIAAMDLASSILHAKVIDADGEEYKREQTPLTGLPDLLDRFATRLAASADMPVTLLMGQSPAGLNATGDSDIRFFYDRVKAAQTQKVRPGIEQVVRVLFASMQVKEPKDWAIEFPPLWQPTEKEQAETRLIQANVDEKEIQNSVVGAREVREARHGGRKYSFGMKLDPAMDAEPVIPGVPEMEGAPALGGTSSDIQKEALNGSQVTSLIEIVTAVASGTIPRVSGQKILELAFQLTPTEALALLGPENFEPTKPEPKPSPFAAGPPVDKAPVVEPSVKNGDNSAASAR